MEKISQELQNRIVRDTNFGRKKRQSYQQIDEIKGTRKMAYRYEVMKLPESFEGKSVLDIGCNLGAVCIEAKRRGAGRVVGFDYKSNIVGTASEFAKSKKCDVSFFCHDINDGLQSLVDLMGYEKFDYVFALSMWKHIDKQKLCDIINYFCKESCWFEGHHKQLEGPLKKELSKYLNFSKIEFLGICEDRGYRTNLIIMDKKMNNHEIDFGEQTIETLPQRKKKAPTIIFDSIPYPTYSPEVGDYNIGDFSVFFNYTENIGYKVFLSYNKNIIKYEKFFVYSLPKVTELMEIYNILYLQKMAPFVYELFSADVYFDNRKDKYVTYGLKMQRIIREEMQEKEPIDDKENFKQQLAKTCLDNGLVRLEIGDRRRLNYGMEVTGSVYDIVHETCRHFRYNYIYSNGKFIVVDIDPMWFINEGMIPRKFEF